MSSIINNHNSAEDMCRAYITKYCEQYKVSPEEAQRHKIVQEYMYWVSKEYNNESVLKRGGL